MLFYIWEYNLMGKMYILQVYFIGSNPVVSIMYLLLIFFSLMSSCLAGLFGSHFGTLGSSLITNSCLFLSFFLSIFIFYEVSFFNCFVYMKLAVWMNSEILNMNWSFMFDSLTALMCIVVTFISFLVHFYSNQYMSTDPHLPRFMSYLSLFTFFMERSLIFYFFLILY